MSRRSEARDKLLAKQREDDIRWFIGSVRGRRMLRAMIENSGYGRHTFMGNSRDAYEAGRQKVVAGLVEEIKALTLEQFHLMEIEGRTEETSANHAETTPDDNDDLPE
jgi:hypothetical protein